MSTTTDITPRLDANLTPAERRAAKNARAESRAAKAKAEAEAAKAKADAIERAEAAKAKADAAAAQAQEQDNIRFDNAELSNFEKLCARLAKSRETNKRELIAAVRAAVNDALHSKSADKANIVARYLTDAKIRAALVFATGGYTRREDGTYEDKPDLAVLEWHKQQSCFGIRPMPEAEYIQRRNEWSTTLRTRELNKLRADTEPPVINLQAKIKKFFAELEKAKEDGRINAAELELFRRVQALAAALDS